MLNSDIRLVIQHFQHYDYAVLKCLQWCSVWVMDPKGWCTICFTEKRESSKVFLFLPWQHRCCIPSSVSMEAFFKHTLYHQRSVVFGVSEEDKQHSREPEVCNCIPTDNRLEQQPVPRGRQINRSAQPVGWHYLCRNQYPEPPGSLDLSSWHFLSVTDLCNRGTLNYCFRG